MKKEVYEIIDLGFSVSDAEGISFNYEKGNVLLIFKDWREKLIKVKFENALGFKFQDAEYFNSNLERFGSCHVVLNSGWLKLHEEKGETWDGETWEHYKFNFNAGGIIEVLCSKVVVVSNG